VSQLQDPLLRAMAALRAALLEVGEPHMLIGGTAVILRGIARLTDDVDATVWAEDLDVEEVLAVLARHEIVGRIPDAAAFAREHQVLLLQHTPTATPMELSLAWLPFERDALQRAELLDVSGVDIPVAVAEDLVIYKTVAWRDRDRTDVERLLRAYLDDIDVSYVRAAILDFAEALDERERVKDFEDLLARVRTAARRPPQG
jgi:Nucleotidyltransferase of unknown function (DUF6036)